MSGETFLLPERPLVLLPGLARGFGIVPALLLQKIYYMWLLPGGINDAHGQHWTWQSVEDLRESLGDAVDESTIRRALGKLEAAGAIVAVWRSTIDLSCDRRDRTKAYRIDCNSIFEICGKPINPAESKMQNARLQSGKTPRSKRAKLPLDIRTQSTSHKVHTAAAGAAAAGAAANNKQEAAAKSRRVRASGLVCWTADDQEAAATLEAEAAGADLQAAVGALIADGKEPVPGRVAREVQRARGAREQAERAKAREENGPVVAARRRAAQRSLRDVDPAQQGAAADAISNISAMLRVGGDG